MENSVSQAGINLNLINKSKEHYKNANETYLEHMRVAIKISFELLV